MTIPALKPGRAIEGISAVLLPYLPGDRPDWESFRALLDRTWTAGLTPAVNMDTGYVNLLTPAERARVLSETMEVGGGRRFIAGLLRHASLLELSFVVGGAGHGVTVPETNPTHLQVMLMAARTT